MGPTRLRRSPRDLGLSERFAYRYREGESQYERFQVHKTIFPADFLADLGFRSLRRSGQVELARLELGGLNLLSKSGARSCCEW